jgi:hypothetical protein
VYKKIVVFSEYSVRMVYGVWCRVHSVYIVHISSTFEESLTLQLDATAHVELLGSGGQSGGGEEGGVAEGRGEVWGRGVGGMRRWMSEVAVVVVVVVEEEEEKEEEEEGGGEREREGGT